jgi:hypothetical protein
MRTLEGGPYICRENPHPENRRVRHPKRASVGFAEFAEFFHHGLD